jgi:leucyl/phenylalanyl-tRNA---protein transferase
MSKIHFPPVKFANASGLLGYGGELTVENLLNAYHNGIFPWPFDERFIAWFSPPQRGVLFLEEAHFSRSLISEFKKHNYSYRINYDFRSVIEACGSIDNRKYSNGSWITTVMKKGYYEFHKEGYAMSFECYDGKKLIGGLYGVRINKYFSGESMFYRVKNASKLTLLFTVYWLRSQNITWIDCQVLNRHIQQFNAREIPRYEFLELLSRSI